MAAGILSKPNTLYGPCGPKSSDCAHTDCSATRAIAQTVCRYCVKQIGYERRFYNDAGYVHADCFEDAVAELDKLDN